MIVPNPPVKLEGHCSVIHENTLYAYSHLGFASIPLHRNGTWTELDPGRRVSGASCVSAGVNGHHNEQALYVIGGTGASDDYTGIQRYSFQSKKWETLTPTSPVMGNRTDHRAVYLKSSSAILVYAGNMEGSSTPSSDTFLIDTAPPYTVTAWSGYNASPAIDPVLLPWNDHEAALVGGTTDRKVHLFHSSSPTEGGWRETKMSLAHKLPDDVRCALLSRQDGSKVLESFDMTVSPNTVTSVALMNANGKPAKPGHILGNSASKRATKHAPFGKFPTYDGQFASTKKWKDYSLAQGDNNMVVISGGDGTDSLAIFNQTSNSWMNATKLFYGDEPKQQILGPTTTSTSTSTSTPTSSPSQTGAPAGDGDSTSVGTIVGATLGGVCGAAVILVIILLFLKKAHNKRAAQDAARDKRLSFQDQGEEPLARSAYPMAKSPIPLANSSVDSLAIVSGNVGDEKSPRHLGAGAAYGQQAAPAASPLSTIQSNGHTTPANDKAFEAQESAAVGQAGDRRTDEGWSKYFVGNNSATDLARPQSDRSLSGSDFGSAGSKENAWPMKSLTPLNFGFLDQPKPLGQVVSGSPTTEHSPSGQDGRGLVIPEGQAARISSADSVSVTSDDTNRRQDSWPNFPAHAGGNGHVPRAAQHSWLGRPPSSTYSSVYYGGPNRETMTSNGRQSSVVIPEDMEGTRRDNVNTDMSWLNLNAER